MTTMRAPATADELAPPSSRRSRRAPKRDYSLTGESARLAIEKGLAAAEWYHTEVPRQAMKELMQRRDGPALRDTGVWIALHLLFGGVAVWLSLAGHVWWSVPFWLAYGVLYGSACDSRWHECGHGTAFRTRWMNDVVYHIASFQVMRNPVAWRWSHARHHTDTIIVGRDFEIAWMLPPNMIKKVFHFIGIWDTAASLRNLGRNALGILTPDEKNFIPPSEWPKAIAAARIHAAIYAATALAMAGLYWAGWGWASLIPGLLIGAPRVYGCWHFIMTGLIQHGGLAENVVDHRLNSRTCYMNPVSRWLYWNMNYHVEHHMFPMVPYYNLPRLHELIKHDLPAPNTSIWDAYREMIPAVWRQRIDPDHYVRRELPPTAKPYKEELHTWVPERGMA